MSGDRLRDRPKLSNHATDKLYADDDPERFKERPGKLVKHKPEEKPE